MSEGRKQGDCMVTVLINFKFYLKSWYWMKKQDMSCVQLTHCYMTRLLSFLVLSEPIWQNNDLPLQRICWISKPFCLCQADTTRLDALHTDPQFLVFCHVGARFTQPIMLLSNCLKGFKTYILQILQHSQEAISSQLNILVTIYNKV